MNLFLSHIISDYAFSNVYTDSFRSKKDYYKHFIWMTLVFLAFNYDFIMTSQAIILAAAYALHIALDFIRIKIGPKVWFECLGIALFLAISFFTQSQFKSSYISYTFQIYLIGMMCATSIGSWLFRVLNINEKQKKDTTGGTERLVIFIFILAHQYILAGVAVLCGVAYKMFIEKKRNKEIILSPVYAAVVSALWMFLMSI